MKKILFILALALFIPSFSHAATKAKAKVVAKPVIQCVESTAQVADLQAQIASLQAQLAQKNTVQTNNLSVNLNGVSPATNGLSEVTLSLTNSGKTPVTVNKIRFEDPLERPTARMIITGTGEAMDNTKMVRDGGFTTIVSSTTREMPVYNNLVVAPDMTVNLHIYNASNMVITKIMTSDNTNVVGLPINVRF